MTTVTLDCESVDSTYASVAEITQLPADRLRQVLLEADQPASDELLLEQLREHLGGVKTSDFRTCWFHLTRAQESATFSEGLLPLNLSLDAVWRHLESLADSGSAVDFGEFRARLGKERCGHYGSKVTNVFHWGPYGVLVRDVAFRGDFGSEHFFDAPEIVVDICNLLRDRYGTDLLERFDKATKPVS